MAIIQRQHSIMANVRTIGSVASGTRINALMKSRPNININILIINDVTFDTNNTARNKRKRKRSWINFDIFFFLLKQSKQHWFKIIRTMNWKCMSVMNNFVEIIQMNEILNGKNKTKWMNEEKTWQSIQRRMKKFSRKSSANTKWKWRNHQCWFSISIQKFLFCFFLLSCDNYNRFTVCLYIWWWIECFVNKEKKFNWIQLIVIERERGRRHHHHQQQPFLDAIHIFSWIS